MIGLAGVYRWVDAIRCELDNWVQCEYKRDELSNKVFFDLHYRELPKDDPLAHLFQFVIQPFELTDAIDALEADGLLSHAIT